MKKSLNIFFIKKIKILFAVIFCSVGFYFSSCNENTVKEDLTVKKGFNYYPLEVGKYIVYQLDSLVYHSESGGQCNFVTDTSSWLLKEEVVDVFTDNAGKENYKIERFIRKTESDPWLVIDVWSTLKTDTQIERVEENLRFIKMVFPVSEGIGWNGNTYFKDTTISLAGELIDFYTHWSNEYEYLTVDVPETINGIALDSVTTIAQSEPNGNKINYRLSTEKYARSIGLVFKEMWILDTQCCESAPDLAPCDGIPWEEKAERGLILRQSIVDYN